ncbi:phage holin family protein [Nostoc sp.]|uniref:phage holin family protein n=1 Tax=Nostoc sp. TaxID=1180 RepID=UPI002FF6029D
MCFQDFECNFSVNTQFFAFPLILQTLGLFFFILNAIIFVLAAYFIEDFRLIWGF